MNVLFIGNSYTYYNDLDQVFEQLCRANGREVSAYRVTKGGRKLIANTDPRDPITQELVQALAERRYEACFIQEQSVLPASDYDTFRQGLEQVRQMIGDRADRLYLYATWGRKAGHTVLEKYGWTTRTMAEALLEGYTRAAREIGATVSPVGKSFLWVTEHCPDMELYDPDKTHPSYLGTCLAALTHYHTLFGEYPDQVPAELTAEQRSAFCKVVTC